MKVKVIQETSWNRALNAARTTIGKQPVSKQPSSEWEARILLAEHAPVKLVEYKISFSQLKQWVGVHLLRHGFQIPMIHSQRGDRRDLHLDYPEIDKVFELLKDDLQNPSLRDCLPQGAPNDQDFYVNAQTLINISRKRLCSCASKETREAWQAVKDAISEFDPTMASKMVRECIYRGFCPEMFPACEFCKSEEFRRQLEEYRKEAPSQCK